MDKKELRHRVERSQVELDYWRSKADQMGSVLNHLETDYLTHRTDCCFVRQGHFREAVNRALDTVAVLEGGGGGMLPDIGATSSTQSEAASLLAAPQPTSTASASDFSRNMKRLANRSHLKSMTKAELESELSRNEARARHQRDHFNDMRGRLATLANDYDELQMQACCACRCDGRLEAMIRTALDRPGRIVDV